MRVRCISLWEPYATAFVTAIEGDLFPLKRFETRHWATSHRGPLAIAAAKRPMDYVGRQTANEYGMAKLNYGHIVGIGNLTDCLPIVSRHGLLKGKRCVALDDEGLVRLWEPQHIKASVRLVIGGHSAGMTSDSEADFGDYTPGRWAWEFDEVKPLRVPYPVVGRQGLFWVDVPDGMQP